MAESAIVPLGAFTTVTLVSSAARATSDTTSWFPMGRYDRLVIFLNVSARSGTSPTLNVYFQNQLPDGSTADDLISFTQKTNTGSERVYYFEANNTTPAAPTDATLAAGSVKAGLIGPFCRLKWVIGGTNPSFTFSITAHFKSAPI